MENMVKFLIAVRALCCWPRDFLVMLLLLSGSAQALAIDNYEYFLPDWWGQNRYFATPAVACDNYRADLQTRYPAGQTVVIDSATGVPGGSGACTGHIHACGYRPWYPFDYNCTDSTQVSTRTWGIATCSVATATSGPCGAAVAAMQAVVKDSTDPTRVFHATQTCIAQTACAMRCHMDNCNWLTAVVPAFVNRYLNQTGDWPTILANCASGGPGAKTDLECAGSEARYHIFNDLVPTLTAYGCGSTNDWNQVFNAIKTCTTQTVGVYFSGAGAVAYAGVYLARQVARVGCTTGRAAAGQNVDINGNLAGYTCTP